MRACQKTRKTSETDINCKLNLDGSGDVKVNTGIGFFDHMLTSMAKHAGFDLTLSCNGDLHIDDHHTVEDCAITIGQCFDEALGEKLIIKRFGYAYAPLDEALARTVVDICRRPTACIELDLTNERIGQLAPENLTHFMNSFAMNARLTLHVDVLKGENDHHKAEAAFKSLALALKSAVKQTEAKTEPSTKGSL